MLTVVVLEYALRPGLGAKYQTDPLVILSGYLLVHICSLQVNLPVAWTLFHKILFYLIFVCMLFRKRFGICILALWCLSSIVMAITPANIYFAQYVFAPVHLLFPLGMLVGWLLRELRLKASSLFFPAGIFVFATAYVLCSRQAIESPGVQWLAGFGSALTILGAAGLELRHRLTIPKPLQLLGDASYSVYLVHYPFLMFLAPVAYKTWRHFHLPLPVFLLGMIACATIAGCVVHLYIEKPILERMGLTKKPAAARD